MTIHPPEKRVVRPATREDIKRYYAEENARVTMTTTAWIGEVDGKAVGLCGLAHIGGRVIAFFDIRDEGRPYKKEILREMRENFINLTKGGRFKYIFAECDPSEESAPRLLRYFGFSPVEDIPRLWRWDYKTASQSKVWQRAMAVGD